MFACKKERHAEMEREGEREKEVERLQDEKQLKFVVIRDDKIIEISYPKTLR